MKLTDVEDDSEKNIRTTAHVEEMAAAMLVTLFLSPPKEKESFFGDDCCIYTKHEGQIFTIQKWHFDLTRLRTVEIIWIKDIGLFSRRVVEGLNVITVLNVITCYGLRLFSATDFDDIFVWSVLKLTLYEPNYKEKEVHWPIRKTNSGIGSEYFALYSFARFGWVCMKYIHIRYWPSVRSRWMDIGQVLLLRFCGPRRSRGP